MGERRPVTTLNDLPESLLIHILTLLPILSAIKTSFISRQWRNLWHLMPTLKFKEEDDHPNTITKVLLNRSKSNLLRQFSLDFSYADIHQNRSFVPSWIRYVLDCNVEDMSLRFGVGEDEEEPLYSFHFLDIKNKPMRCLNLWRCEIVMPQLGSIQFDSLRVLYLTCVLVNDDSLADLIARCKNLEKLHLCDFDGLRNFKICSKSLKVLKLINYFDVSDESSVEICTPNLSKIKVSYFYAVNYAGDLSSVKLAQLSFWNGRKNSQKYWGNAMNLLRGVESLKIEGMLLRCVLSELQSNGCLKLERLKHLEVQAGHTFNDVFGFCVLLERAPALQTLVIDGVDQANSEEKFFDEFSNMEFKLHIPSLMEVKMMRIRNTMFEYWILLLLWKHGVVLNKVVLVPAVLGEPIAVLDPKSTDFIKFLVERSSIHLSYSNSGIEVLHQELRKRFELEAEKFKLYYKDDDGNWIISSCNEDLLFHLETSKTPGRQYWNCQFFID